jgi:hypothetical protein
MDYEKVLHFKVLEAMIPKDQKNIATLKKKTYGEVQLFEADTRH